MLSNEWNFLGLVNMLRKGFVTLHSCDLGTEFKIKLKTFELDKSLKRK